MDLSIIIVNWNSKDYLQNCLASITAAPPDLSHEIVVIDSGSFDGSADMVCRLFKQVRFVQSEKNLGFARANNEAFRHSRGRTLLFLNPDTELQERAIDILYRHLNTLPHAGIAGAKLLNSDRSVQLSCIRAFPTIANQVFESDLLRGLFPGSRLWGMRPLLSDVEEPCAVDAVSGACMMIKRTAFERINRFSTDYFMYSEDIDLCLKVRKAGLTAYYVPTAVVVHHGGASSEQAPVNAFSSVMLLESRWRYFHKTRSPWYSGLYRLAMFSASLARVAAALFLWPASGHSRAKQVLGKWTARLRWSLGGERWVKNY